MLIFAIMSVNPVVRKLLKAFAMLLAIIMIGVTGFHWIEGYDFIDSLYMTIITMSTVGYEVLGDRGLSFEGKIFVIFLIIFSIGTFLNVVSVITSFIVEGEVRSLFKDYKVNKESTKLRDHVIICGLGRNGREAALELLSYGTPFIVVEKDKDTIERFLESHPEGILLLEGDAIEDEVLEKAQIMYAKGVITSLPDDAANVFVTLTARELNPNIEIVARASNESSITKLRKAGANRVVLPNYLGGRKMAKIMTQPALVDFVDMITGQGQFHMQLEEIGCANQSLLLGKSFRELNIRSQVGVLVLGIQDRTGKFELNPSADKKLESGDRLFILGSESQVKAFRSKYLQR